MSLSIALSGVQAAQTDIDTIGNNISNVSTAGFKQSNAQFVDVYTGARSGFGGSINPGLGVNTGGLPQSFNEGTIQQTGNALDVAINGNGFFQVLTSGGVAYTRDGQFHLDASGRLVSNTGAQVMGLPGTDSANAIATGTPQPIQISTASIPATPTSSAALALNLPSTDAVIDPTTTPFDPTNRASYSESTSFAVFDSLGVSRTLTTYFTDTGSSSGSSQWQTNWQLTDTGGNVVSSGTGPALSFDSNGKLTSGSGTITATGLPNGAADLSVAENFAGTTLSDLSFGVDSINVNGSGGGQFTGLSISANGAVIGQYDNGATRNFGTLSLASFANPQGLTPISGNMWLASPISGAAAVAAPLTAGMGSLESGAVEGSNVDLSTQLVDLISAQQAYQANVQGINIEQQDIQRLLTIQ
jgi:flagellar hook protein FlgE